MTTANKNDKRDKKPAMQFVHPRLALGCGNAMGAGEIKYGGWNFLLGHGRMQLLAAMERHTAAMKIGELIDADTSDLWGTTVYHSDCIAACLNMMYWQEEYGTIIEDRPTDVVNGVVTFKKDETVPEEFNHAGKMSPPSEQPQVGDLVAVTEDVGSYWHLGGTGVLLDIDEEDPYLPYRVKIGLVTSWVGGDRVKLVVGGRR